MPNITLTTISGGAITENIDDIGQLKEYMYHNNSWIVKDDTYYDINDEIPPDLIEEESLNIVVKPPSPKKIADDIIYKNPHLTEEQKNIIRQRLPGDEKKDLKAINVLDLSGLDIKELPESIGDLKSLRRLKLHNNQLEILPEAIGNLGNLKELDLECNQLKSLPESIGRLRNLEGLNLSRNQLEILPEAIGNLGNLERLDLEVNRLESLPESIVNLGSLRHLSLAHNQLKILPELIGNLESLKYLNLAHNKLKEPLIFLFNFVYFFIFQKKFL